MSIKYNIILHIKNYMTSKAKWDKGLYQTTDANWFLFLKTKLFPIKMEANEGVRKYISRIKEFSDKLGDIGEFVERCDLEIATLKGLLPDYSIYFSTCSKRKTPKF